MQPGRERRIGRPGERFEAERAGQEVDGQVVAGAGLEQVLDLFVRLADAELGVEVDDLELGGHEAEAPGQLAADDLRDEDAPPLTGLPELHHVGAEIVGLDHSGQGSALA